MGIEIPHEVALFLNILGVPYPDIDEDQVRELAVNVRDFATNVRQTHESATGVVHEMGSVYSGESYQALVASWARMSSTHMAEFDSACHVVAKALEVAAEVITVVKVAVLVELTALAASYTALMAATVATAGVSAAVTVAVRAAASRLLHAMEEMLVAYIVAEVIGKAIEPLEHTIERMINGVVIDTASDLLNVPPPSGSPATALYIEPDEVLRYAKILDDHADEVLKHAAIFSKNVATLGFTTSGSVATREPNGTPDLPVMTPTVDAGHELRSHPHHEPLPKISEVSTGGASIEDPRAPISPATPMTSLVSDSARAAVGNQSGDRVDSPANSTNAGHDGRPTGTVTPDATAGLPRPTTVEATPDQREAAKALGSGEYGRAETTVQQGTSAESPQAALNVGNAPQVVSPELSPPANATHQRPSHAADGPQGSHPAQTTTTGSPANPWSRLRAKNKQPRSMGTPASGAGSSLPTAITTAEAELVRTPWSKSRQREDTTKPKVFAPKSTRSVPRVDGDKITANAERASEQPQRVSESARRRRRRQGGVTSEGPRS